MTLQHSHTFRGEIQIALYKHQVERELRQENFELESFNRLMVGRELRMIELKQEIDVLCVKFGQPPRYGYGRNAMEG